MKGKKQKQEAAEAEAEAVEEAVEETRAPREKRPMVKKKRALAGKFVGGEAGNLSFAKKKRKERKTFENDLARFDGQLVVDEVEEDDVAEEPEEVSEVQEEEEELLEVEAEEEEEEDDE